MVVKKKPEKKAAKKGGLFSFSPSTIKKTRKVVAVVKKTRKAVHKVDKVMVNTFKAFKLW